MKKIFFIFAMLLMSVVSVMAEELSETFNLATEAPNHIYDGSHFTVQGGYWDTWGLYIDNGDKITISSKGGEKITKVKCDIGYTHNADASRLMVDPDPGSDNISVTGKVVIINVDNATSLDILSDIEGEAYMSVYNIVVYYEQNDNTSIPEECVLTETFPTSGDALSGDNIKVETNSDDLYIGNGNTVTINSNNGADVRIFKVELEFNSNFNGTINSLNDAVVAGSGKDWTISNVYSPSLTISSTTAAQINSINVYYVKMSGEKSVVIPTTNPTQKKLYIEKPITVLGTQSKGMNGLVIDNGQNITITSNNGAEISKVDLKFSYYYTDGGAKLQSTPVAVVAGSGNNWTISNINSSSVKIEHTGKFGDSKAAQVVEVTVYYKEPVAPTEIQLVAASAEGAYWTTFYSNACHYQAPEGTEVYKVNLSGSTITMNKISDGIVTKGEGVVLKSLNSANITLTKADDPSSDNYYGNSLWGTSTQIPNPGNAYVLSYKDTKGLAFYKLKSTGKIPANKAYLLVPSGSNASAQAFFAFDASTTTGVDSINAQDSSEQEEKVYDLQGRRVTKPAKGLYIVNGKKVIMK